MLCGAPPTPKPLDDECVVAVPPVPIVNADEDEEVVIVVGAAAACCCCWRTICATGGAPPPTLRWKPADAPRGDARPIGFCGEKPPPLPSVAFVPIGGSVTFTTRRERRAVRRSALSCEGLFEKPMGCAPDAGECCCCCCC